jgi:carbonic anhydrase
LKRALILTVSMAAVAAAFMSASLNAQEAEHEKYVSPWKTPWDYRGARGADHWSQLDPLYAQCNEGKEQSPIDIRDAVKADLPDLRFDSKSGPVRYVINNGHTIRVNYRRGNGNYLVVDGERYELIQFHFHRPSEESVSGKTYPMEAHLMYQTADGKAAGVTVFIRPGRPNPVVEKLWEHMPNAEGQNEAPGVEVNPSDLLPRNTHAYFMYMGSVTAPPCTEGITWFVLKNPIEISENQIDAFAKLYPNDARSVQPLNGRVVKESR